MASRQQIVERVRSLIALSRSSHQGEAELASERALWLINKHQLEKFEYTTEYDMVKEDYILPPPLYSLPGRCLVVETIGTVSSVAVRGHFQKNKLQKNLTLYGRPEDIQFTTTVAHELLKKGKEEVENLLKRGKYGKDKREDFINCFYVGMSTRLEYRLWSKLSSRPELLSMLSAKEDQVKEKLEQSVPDDERDGVPLTSLRGYMYGKYFGQTVIVII